MVKYSIKRHIQLSELNNKSVYVLWAETEYSCRGVFQGSMEECKLEKERRISMNSNELYKDILKLQRDWQKLFNSKQMTKKAIVELCAPFRDKYNLTDKQTLCIARDELSKQELLNIIESKGE